MLKQGKYVGGYAPYGYVLHPEIRNKLKRDPEAAEVVRRVFDEALAGRNTSQIAPVSYTHLDVYKRQGNNITAN